MKITKVTASHDLADNDGTAYYFGKEEAEKYGDLICEKLRGKTVSKRKDLAEEPGGLIYEARKLGIEDFFDLLSALEGLCWEGRAAEINDSTYKIYGSSNITSSTDLKRISHFNEYDNPHILRGDWKEMSDEEAEEAARQMSIDDPSDIYYVQYDDVMEPCSDKRWLRGKSYDAISQYDEMLEEKRRPVESADYAYVEDEEDVEEYASTLGLKVVDKLVADGFDASADVVDDYLEIEVTEGSDGGYNGYQYIQYFDEIIPDYNEIDDDAQQVYETILEELAYGYD